MAKAFCAVTGATAGAAKDALGSGVSTGTVSDPTSEAAKSGETAKSGQELADAVEANSEAQDYNEKTKPVKAQVVMQEPAAMIASGTGDLDTTGGSVTVV